MKAVLTLALAVGIAALLLPASPARAYTCAQHYEACLGYGNGEVKCGCARKVCLKAVGAKGDAGLKWNGIAGINACFRK